MELLLWGTAEAGTAGKGPQGDSVWEPVTRLTQAGGAGAEAEWSDPPCVPGAELQASVWMWTGREVSGRLWGWAHNASQQGVRSGSQMTQSSPSSPELPELPGAAGSSTSQPYPLTPHPPSLLHRSPKSSECLHGLCEVSPNAPRQLFAPRFCYLRKPRLYASRHLSPNFLFEGLFPR